MKREYKITKLLINKVKIDFKNESGIFREEVFQRLLKVGIGLNKMVYGVFLIYHLTNILKLV